MKIQFTQFLLPDGRKRLVTIDRPEDIGNKAQKLLSDGCRLEIEMLLTGEISMTVERTGEDGEEETLAHAICSNGPEVPVSVDRIILEASE